MHSTEKVHDTTLDNENTSQHMTSEVVTALSNQPEAFSSELGDDESRYLLSGEVNTSEMLVNMSAGSLEDFYPAIAIAILMRFIRDPSLSQHHRTVIQAITFIFKSLGSKCIPYLSQVVPAYLHVIRASEAIFREVLCLL